MRAQTSADTFLRSAMKNKHAVALGKRGGAARAARMTPQQRTAAARKAVEARWRKHTARVSQKGTPQ